MKSQEDAAANQLGPVGSLDQGDSSFCGKACPGFSKMSPRLMSSPAQALIGVELRKGHGVPCLLNYFAVEQATRTLPLASCGGSSQGSTQSN